MQTTHPHPQPQSNSQSPTSASSLDPTTRCLVEGLLLLRRELSDRARSGRPAPPDWLSNRVAYLTSVLAEAEAIARGDLTCHNAKGESSRG